MEETRLRLPRRDRDDPSVVHVPPDDRVHSASVQAQTLALLTVLVTFWLAFSPAWFLLYRLSEGGRDAGLWQSGPGLLALLLAVCRYRAPLTSWRSALGLVVLGPGFVLLPYLVGVDRTGALADAWWNLTVSGGLLTVLAVCGLAHLVLRA